VIAITELSALEALSHGEPLVCELVVRQQIIQVVGRRLKPSETMEVQLLAERALPPIIPAQFDAAGKETTPERYDLRDAGYLQAKEVNRREARALALYSAFPIFKTALEKEAADAPIDRGRIVKFIESRELEDDVLEELFRRVTERTVFARHVGFT